MRFLFALLLPLLAVCACSSAPPQDDACRTAMDAAFRSYQRCLVEAARTGGER